MIDIYARKTFTVYQMLCMLLLFMLQYVLMAHPNIFNVSLSGQNPKSVAETLLIEEKPAPAAVIEEERINLFTHQLKKAEPLYNPIILEAASLHEVDLTMVKAIIMAESGFNIGTISRRGARGLMQLMPGTAKSLGVKDIFDPEENIHAGVRYYKSLLNRFDGDEKLALAAYNAGARNVRKYNGIPPFKETQRYISKVLDYQCFYKHGQTPEKTTAL